MSHAPIYPLPEASKERLFYFFREIAKHPRASGNEKEIADYLCAFAQKHAFFFHRDEADNVLIRIPGSQGRESEQAMILQAHTDMVFVCDDTHKDHRSTEPIRLCFDGREFYAEGTSLGGDDGSGVAIMLAIADDPTLSHPPLELVFTSSEEVGLIGAKALDLSLLQGRRMINLDNDDETSAVIGCAGGRRIDGFRKTELRSIPPREGLRIVCEGGKGGHSGQDIHLGRGNALKLTAKLISELCKDTPFYISSFSSGTVDNAIPSQGEAVILCENTSTKQLQKRAQTLASLWIEEHRNTDPEMRFSFESVPIDQALSLADSKAMLELLLRLPHGVRAFEENTEAVKTSVNCASCHRYADGVRITLSVRSSSNREKEALCDEINEIFSSCGYTVSHRGDYPGWEPKENSPLQALYRNCYPRIFQREAQCLPIHAGLECGIFSEGIPALDAISIGPDCKDIHTPKERMDADSFVRIYTLILELLKRC